MATTSPTPPPVAPKRAGKQLSADQFIERQLGRTQTQVKLVDLAAALMVLVAGVLVYFLAFSLVDHWLFDLGFWGRLLSLLLLLVGAGWYVAARVVPLAMYQINPVYAARAIEQSTPSLKNSLINLLTFRGQRSDVNQLVYRALEVKAATDLTRVPADTVVDRSQVIRVGYVLAGILVCAAIYTIVSPKNPIQTVSRIVAPWSAIDRPARVEILEVQPGHATVFRGQKLEVAASLQGVKSADRVSVVYSTNNRQLVGQTVAMELDPSGLKYESAVPPDSNGCQQDFVYWLEAGDAVSPKYRVKVSPAPTIAVQRVELQFPDYTGRPDSSSQGEGDIHSVEGTRVTLRARANQPIRSARVEFDPLGRSYVSTTSEQSSHAHTNRLPMEFDEQTAWCSFTLQLKTDRRTPVHGSYQLRFVTVDGHESQQPILHRIEVTPDFGPEIEVLTPTQNRTEVPENARQRIEIRAVDPDYGLKRIRLRAVSGGSELLDQTLFDQPRGQLGQTVVNYMLQPASLGLAANDRVTFWAVADDNRTEANGNAAPNSERTRTYELLIVAAESARAGAADRPAADRQSETTDENSDPNQKSTVKEQGQGSESGGASGDESGEGADSASGKGQSGSSQAESEAANEDSNDPGEGGSSHGNSGEGGESTGASEGNSPSEDQQGPGQGSAGDTSSGSGGAEPASGREPLHDGEVFEKALERLRELEEGDGTAGDQRGSGQPGDKRSDGGGDSRSTAGNASQEKGPAGRQEGTTLKDPNGQAADDRPGSDPQSPQAEADGGPKQPDVNQGAGAQKQAAPGEGGTSQQSGAERNRGQKPDVPGQPDQREKEPGIGDNDDSGAGENSRDKSGSGSVESSQDRPVENQDRDKSINPDTSEPQPPGDPGTTNSRRQSDTEGAASGDQSGGGQKGSGQGANQAGNDSAGGNSSSDDGAGASQESGVGETADAPGQKQRADGKTGAAGNEQGSGSAARDDPSGQRDGGGPGQGRGANQTDPRRRDQQPGKNDGKQGPGQPLGGGTPADNSTASNQLDQLEVPEGDDANLEYARRATNLVLEHLKHQQQAPDQKLLDKLGWSADDLRQFLARWQQMQDAARRDPKGRRELDETLRSLGIRPQRDRVRRGGASSDQLKGLRESGPDSAPPSFYRRQYEAFKKGSDG